MTAIPVNDTAPVGAPVTDHGPVRFLGKENTYWRLMIRGAVLLLLTLGIYRFWLATDQRRFLWGNTELAGQSFEYNGTALELLLGFLMAMAILVPINVVIFLAAALVGLDQVAPFVAFLLLAVFGQFAVYRARRYRLTRTVFRGVRFHQSGSGWLYAFYASLWWLLIALTLGLAYPWAQAGLERYKMRNTFYGDLRGKFDGTGWRLFVRGIGLWAIIVAPFLLGLIALPILMTIDSSEFRDALKQSEVMAGTAGRELMAVALAGFGILGAIWTVLAAALLYPAFQAITLGWWTSGLRFGEIEMTSRLRIGQIYRLYLRFLGYAILFMLAAVIAGLVALGSAAALPQNILEVAVVVAPFVAYVLLALGFSTIYQVTVKLGIWRVAAESLDLTGLVVLERVKAEGRPSSSFGEGLADALNVGGL
jgi:uncharacterized membrane protein YjgN (DUF898 family)